MLYQMRLPIYILNNCVKVNYLLATQPRDSQRKTPFQFVLFRTLKTLLSDFF